MTIPSGRRPLPRRVRRPGVTSRHEAPGRGLVELPEQETAGAWSIGTVRAGGRRSAVGTPSTRRRNPAFEALEGRPLLAPFVFDPDGGGALAPQQISRFDFLAGDALEDNANGLPVGGTF